MVREWTGRCGLGTGAWHSFKILFLVGVITTLSAISGLVVQHFATYVVSKLQPVLRKQHFLRSPIPVDQRIAITL